MVQVEMEELAMNLRLRETLPGTQEGGLAC